MARRITRARALELLQRCLSIIALTIAALPLAPQALLATAQRPDVLIVGTDTFSINTNPLEPYLLQHPGVMPTSGAISTDNWRGYVATWEVRNDQLFLVDITIEHWTDSAGDRRLADRSVLRTVFPGDTAILADWFNGWLIVPTGELVEYVHLGYASTFESYRIFRVREGRVIEQRQATTEEFVAFRQKQFARYRKTPEYVRAFEALKKRSAGETDSDLEEFLSMMYAGSYTSIDFGD